MMSPLKFFVLWDARDAVIIAAQSAEHALKVAQEHGLEWCTEYDRIEEIVVPLHADVVWEMDREEEDQ